MLNDIPLSEDLIHVDVPSFYMRGQNGWRVSSQTAVLDLPRPASSFYTMNINMVLCTEELKNGILLCG